jgi:serine/threonine-protein kinase HipA
MAEDMLAVWLDGHDGVAGHLARDDGETAFFYAPDYIAAGGPPLSLPVERGEFGDLETRAYFANLLPENE